MSEDAKEEQKKALVPEAAAAEQAAPKELAIDDYSGPGTVEAVPPGVISGCCWGSKPEPPLSVSPFVKTDPEDKPRKVKNILVILNPFGGNGRGARAWVNVKRVFEEAKVDYELKQTQHAGHATELARTEDLSKYDALAIIGGDGTINETITGLFARPDWEEKPIPVGLISGGTGNSVTVTLDETDPVETAKQIVAGYVRGIDIGKIICEEEPEENRLHWTINIVAWGLGVDANETAENCRCCGRMRYDVGALWQICRGAQRHAQLEIDGVKLENDFSTIMVQNNQHSGVDLRITPYAKVDDGFMDVVVCEQRPRGRILGMFDELKRGGSHVFLPEVDYIRFKKMRLSSETKTLLNIDGENKGSTPMTLEVFKQYLPIFYNFEKAVNADKYFGKSTV
eukprot:TRINITY_DN22456_c0_g1_i2.p2 TRINITY_DN22456_c0_g1~~TRINITY_DN22456_c0_g1_i2.p2  ORF type:complete len:397 (+),score=222.70 TRINITY_DN22456_c0_g1_i2:56-1246(+)